MRWLALLLVFLPAYAFAAPVSGIDDVKPNIPVETQERLDTAIITYYQQPTVAKINTVLDIMATSDVLRKKTAWPTFVGFLTVVFAHNKNHVMSWISRNDYNTYAEDVMIASLLHAGLRETALVFAQAQQWKPEDLDHIRNAQDTTNLKKLDIVLPGHIDTLWGAYFGSGDPVYVNEIISVLFMKTLPQSDTVNVPPGHKIEDVLAENQRLAHNSLVAYALDQDAVRKIITARKAKEKSTENKKILDALLPQMSFATHK